MIQNLEELDNTFNEAFYYQSQPTKCKYCGKWFKPTPNQVNARFIATIKFSHGDSNIYCSNECKKNCPLFNKRGNIKSILSGGIDKYTTIAAVCQRYFIFKKL